MFGERSRVVVLAGSPLPKSLDWSEESLMRGLLPAFADGPNASASSSLADVTAVWRSLHMAAFQLSTGLTQGSKEDCRLYSSHNHVAGLGLMDQMNGFFITTDRAQGRGESASPGPTAHHSQVLSQYYERSFAAHEEIQSSQIIGAEIVDETSSLTSVTSSFESASSNPDSQKHLAYAKLRSVYISDLNEIPHAAYLSSIVPQTMTVNVVAGIIAISQPRTITTRKDGQIVELVEMLVGDDTRAGFGINLWIRPAPAQTTDTSRNATTDNLRDEVLRLRPRDVIFVRRVALGSFRSKVYGQSLRRGITTIDLLYRDIVDAEDARGAFKAKEINANVEDSSQFAKVKRVRDWVVQFVGTRPATESSRRKKCTKICSEKIDLPSLPPDTQ